MNGIAAFLASAVMAVFGSPATTTPAAMPVQSCAAITKVLQIGSRGEEVMRLQKMLGVETTGYFGALTKKKLIEWQLSKNIILSAKTAGAGTTGPKTRAAMKCVPVIESPKHSAEPRATPPVQAATSTPAPATQGSTPAPAGGSGSSGGGASYVSPYGYTCAPPGEKPAPSSCTSGSWQLSPDEAGCVLWACIDSDDRG